MSSQIYATLGVGLSYIQQGLGSIREKLYTDTADTHPPNHDMDTGSLFVATHLCPTGTVGLNLVSKFVRSSIQPSTLLGSGFAALHQAVDETTAALSENTFIDPAGQDLLNQQVHIETCDAGTQTNGIDHRRPVESDPDLGLSGPGGNHVPNVTLFEDNHGSQAESLALTLFRPSQHDDPQIEQLKAHQGLQEVFLGEHLNLVEELDQENILLRSQCEDLLYRCAGLKSDLDTSFIEKTDLQDELASAERTIEKGIALYQRSELKLDNMTRLFEANTEKEKFVLMLEQQKILGAENDCLLAQLQNRLEENRYLRVQLEAVVQTTSYDRLCAMTAEIENLHERLSTLQAQLAESDTAKLRLSAELQHERNTHRATRKAIESKYKMRSSSSHLHHTAYAGGSAPQKPSKFNPAYTIASHAPLPKAGTHPQLFSEQNSEYIFGAIGDIPKEYGTRSKSKFSFGDDTVSESTQSKSKFTFGHDTVSESTQSESKFFFGDETAPESTSSATGTAIGPTPRTDFSFTFGGSTDHHSSSSGYDNTTGPELSNYSTSAANIFLAPTFSADPQQTTNAPSPGNPNVPLSKTASPQNFDEFYHGDQPHIEHSHAQPFAGRGLNTKTKSPQYFDEYHHGTRAHEEHLHDHFPAGGLYTASKFPTEVKDNIDLFGGWGLNLTPENSGLYNSAEPADGYTKQKGKNVARKPPASDFFDEDPIDDAVETNTKDALPVEEISEEVAILSAVPDISQESHIEVHTNHTSTVDDNIQTSSDDEYEEATQTKSLLSPILTVEPPPAPSEEKFNPANQPKKKPKTSKRALLRKAAKERKRAPVGEADWTS